MSLLQYKMKLIIKKTGYYIKVKQIIIVKIIKKTVYLKDNF